MIIKKPTRKKLLTLVILAATAAVLTGCAAQNAFEGTMATDTNGFSMEYTILDREMTSELKLDEGDGLRVELSHDSGRVDITVGQEGRDPVYSGRDQANAAFEIIITEGGTYRVSVTGHRARGRISFTRVHSETE